MWFSACAVLPHQTQAQEQTPHTADEWKAFNAQVFALYKAEAYSNVIHVGRLMSNTLLANSESHYVTTICVALAFQRMNRAYESLPFFEKAMSLYIKQADVHYYVQAAWQCKSTKRAIRVLYELEAQFPAQRSLIDSEGEDLIFYNQVEQGDRAYLAGQKQDALVFYQKAWSYYQRIPRDSQAQATFLEGTRHIWNEYTYFHLYDTPDGYLHLELLDKTFLKQKIQLCLTPPVETNPVVFKMAGLIVRNSNYAYNNKGQEITEVSHLEDRELDFYKQTWQFTADAILLYSKGKLKVETTWIDLPNVTITGLNSYTWKDLFEVRFLDPAKLAPPQDDLFQSIVKTYDGALFVWSRGHAERGYGGGAFQLPYKGQLLPFRAVIRSLPSDSTNAWHEFMHSMWQASGLTPHGLRGDWTTIGEQYQTYNVTDQGEWYAHILASITNWQKTKFLEAQASPTSAQKDQTQGD